MARGGHGKRKGGAFERLIASKLSEWWTNGKHDDYFWRSAGSGGRATVRGRRGKNTSGHASDIAATCGYAEPLTKLLVFEAKRGYSKDTIHDIFDHHPDRKSLTQYQEWFEQATLAAKYGKVPFWMVIHQRNGRDIMSYVPAKLIKLLQEVGCAVSGSVHFVRHRDREALSVVGMQLSYFFDRVCRMDVLAVLRHLKKGKKNGRRNP